MYEINKLLAYGKSANECASYYIYICNEVGNRLDEEAPVVQCLGSKEGKEFSSISLMLTLHT
jgi:hypothetical protein